MTDDADLMVHAMIGRLFEEPEPTHRTDLADSAIAHGMAATRRRGFAVAGATLSVLAVVAGAAVVSGGSQGGGSFGAGDTGASSQAYEDSRPTYADRQREVSEQLPAVLRPLLPAGVTVSPDQTQAGTGVDMQSGDYLPALMLRFEGSDFRLTFDGADAGDAAGYADTFAKRSVAPVPAAGGTIRVLIDPPAQTPSGPHGSSSWYEFAPADKAEPVLRFWIYGDSKVSPIDVAAFQKMAAEPGFAALRRLQDPSIKASAAAVQERYTIEAKINAAARTVLPPGFRLKLNPGAPGSLELVGPDGVNTFFWESLTGATAPVPCSVGAVCYSGHGLTSMKKLGPDGKARLGIYVGYTGPSTASSIMLHVFGLPGAGMESDSAAIGKPGSETAAQGHGLTPQEAMAIIQAPDAAKVIADVRALVAVK